MFLTLTPPLEEAAYAVASPEFPNVLVQRIIMPEYGQQDEFRERYKDAFWNAILSEPEMQAI